MSQLLYPNVQLIRLIHVFADEVNLVMFPAVELSNGLWQAINPIVRLSRQSVPSDVGSLLAQIWQESHNYTAASMLRENREALYVDGVPEIQKCIKSLEIGGLSNGQIKITPYEKIDDKNTVSDDISWEPLQTKERLFESSSTFAEIASTILDLLNQKEEEK